MYRIILILTLALAACTGAVKKDKPIIAVTILPQKQFIEKIAGDKVDVMVLVEPGSSPELYNLKPSQMASLAKADAWIGIGKIEFEQVWKQKILDNNPNLKYFDGSRNINWIAQEEIDHGDHKHLSGEDPHIWTSAIEGKTIANNTYEALASLFPVQKEAMAKAHATFQDEISQVQAQLAQIFEKSETKAFLIFHPSLGYLARDFNLEQIPIEIEGKEPSPKYLQSFVDLARAKGLQNIFVQKEFNKGTAQQMSKEIGGAVIEVDPLNEDWMGELLIIANKLATKP